jgi:hypothetical protein
MRKLPLTSYLLIATGLIGIIKYFILPGPLATSDLLIALFNVFFFAGLGLFLIKNYSWTKYLVLVLAVFGLINFPNLQTDLTTPAGIISIVAISQRVLLLSAALVLFMKKNKSTI